ncbi:MAG: PTS sugar transporter subunit IIC [Erysipelotrichaceae bacterium]|nr:PTS sugar transporter subunit IIC [Erysipelotrichaceae bacterium]
MNMAVIIVGSLACLLAFIDVPAWQAFLAANPVVQLVCMKIQSMTLSIFALYQLVVLPYVYANALGMRQALAIVPVTVAAYLLLMPHELYTAIYSEWLGHKGIIAVILVTLVVVRTCKFFIDHKLSIRMPAGVPKFVEDGFALVVPAALIFVVFAIIEQLMEGTTFGCIYNVVYTLLQKPFSAVGLSLVGSTITEATATLSNFLGLHASTIVGFIDPLRNAANLENLEAWQAGQPLPNIICQAFTSLAVPGAGGCAICCTLAFLLFAKSKRYQTISRIAVVPGIFGIGEPILFGLPVMLNAKIFIPWMVVTIFNHIFSYVVIATGLVGRMTGVSVSWTIPNFIAVWLASSTPLRCFIALIVEVAIDLAIYYPFVKIMDREALEEEAAAEQA